MNLKQLFDKPKVIGLVANVNEGKSNTLYYLLDALSKDFNFSVYTYGLKCEFPNTKTIYSVDEMEQIKDSLIILDEVFNLWDLDNRKSKRQIENTLRLIHHNNNILIVCGLAENFKKFLSAKLDAVIFKKVSFADLINGSRVKNILMGYKGNEKGSTVLNLDIDRAIVYNPTHSQDQQSHYTPIHIPYMKQYDTKLNNVSILIPKNAQENNVQKNVEKEQEVIENG